MLFKTLKEISKVIKNKENIIKKKEIKQIVKKEIKVDETIKQPKEEIKTNKGVYGLGKLMFNPNTTAERDFNAMLMINNLLLQAQAQQQ